MQKVARLIHHNRANKMHNLTIKYDLALFHYVIYSKGWQLDDWPFCLSADGLINFAQKNWKSSWGKKESFINFKADTKQPFFVWLACLEIILPKGNKVDKYPEGTNFPAWKKKFKETEDN